MTSIQRLMVEKMGLDAVPPGGNDVDVLRFLQTPGALSTSAIAAREWVTGAILAIRQANEPNPWKFSSDEAIAEEILRQVQARRSTNRHTTGDVNE